MLFFGVLFRFNKLSNLRGALACLSVTRHQVVALYCLPARQPGQLSRRCEQLYL